MNNNKENKLNNIKIISIKLLDNQLKCYSQTWSTEIEVYFTLS